MKRGRRSSLVGCVALSALMAAAGCGGMQSAVSPASPEAARIADLWWVFLAVCTAVFLAVAAAVGAALVRRPRQDFHEMSGEGEPVKVRVIAGATALTIVILVVLLVYSISVDRANAEWPGAERRPVLIEVIGHQFWWEIKYIDEVASRSFTTANEIRIPVGRPVIVRAISRDVIHSFWVPRLHGKVDLVPGRINTIWFEAAEPGVFRGQCAEFCGLQHAKMALVVIAEPDEQFEAWREVARQPAPAPISAEGLRGRQVFLDEQCALCHTIRGTGAWATAAPDLTRIGERRTIAAGTLPNNRGTMAAWIVDPQQIKPGSYMPPTRLDPASLQALVTYLEELR